MFRMTAIAAATAAIAMLNVTTPTLAAQSGLMADRTETAIGTYTLAEAADLSRMKHTDLLILDQAMGAELTRHLARLQMMTAEFNALIDEICEIDSTLATRRIWAESRTGADKSTAMATYMAEAEAAAQARAPLIATAQALKVSIALATKSLASRQELVAAGATITTR